MIKAFSFKNLVIGILTFFSCGCIVVPAKNTDAMLSYKLNLPSKCQLTPVNFIYLDEGTKRGFSTSKYVDPNEKSGGFPKWPSFYVANEFEKSGLFKINLKDNTDVKYLIEIQTSFSMQSGNFQKAWYWATFVTLGILPSYGSGFLQVKAIVKDTKGNLIKELQSTEADISTWNGILMTPLAFISKENSELRVSISVLPKLADELLNKMINEKIVCTEQ